MRLKIYISALFLLLFFAFHAKAQDIHFSQFFATPLSLSPSNTGNYEGDWRLMSNYRSQWKAVGKKPYATQSIGGDIQLFARKEKFSAGLFIINDKSGGNLKVNKILLSAAYHKQINKNRFHIGIQPGFVMKNIDYASESYPNQLNWNTGKFDNTLANKEIGISNQLSYFDINMGIGWSYEMTRLIPYTSFSMFHLNNPNESFFDNANKLELRNVFSTGCFWFSTNKLTLAPNILYMRTTTASEFLMGSNVYLSLDKGYSIQKAVYAGVFFRKGFSNLTDAAITTVGMNYKNYTAGISYDVNISELKTATNLKGAIELSLIYTAINSRLKIIKTPCDRY